MSEPVTVPSFADFEALERRVRALEGTTPDPGPGPGPDPDPGPGPDPVFPIDTQGKYPTFEDLGVSSAAVAWASYRSQAEADWFTTTHHGGGLIVYDADLDATAVRNVKGSSGVPLQHECNVPMRFGPPVVGDTWWLVYDLWFDPVLKDIMVVEDRNLGTKFMHPRGYWQVPGGTSQQRDGIFKTQLHMPGKPAFGPDGPAPPSWDDVPEVGRFFAESNGDIMPGEPIGNTTDYAPVKPTQWPQYLIMPGRWIRVISRWTVGDDGVGRPASRYAQWVRDEVMDAPLQTLGASDTGGDDLACYYPWDPVEGKGIVRLQLKE